jgi:hypothetical protein
LGFILGFLGLKAGRGLVCVVALETIIAFVLAKLVNELVIIRFSHFLEKKSCIKTRSACPGPSFWSILAAAQSMASTTTEPVKSTGCKKIRDEVCDKHFSGSLSSFWLASWTWQPSSLKARLTVYKCT